MTKLVVVGTGPGNWDEVTPRAKKAMEEADLLVGYHVYLDLLKEYFPEKEMYSTPMTQEIQRCHYALEQAKSGKQVAVLSSGDAGVYGMAGLLLELAQDYPGVQVEIIPGITAALSGAALLGAPLMSDFVVMSLSDLLTPWELIEKRLHGAGMGEFPLMIYNPGSKKRVDHLKKACDILLQYRSGKSWCALLRQIGREEENIKLLSLEALREEKVDMFTTVYIGTEKTKRVGEHLITPRGYENK